jgi:CDP-glycerol:poly(glycerophosphate) glycerophosphotransferase
MAQRNWLRRHTLRALRRVDDRARRQARRLVVAYLRHAMHAGILDPVAQMLVADKRITVRYLAETPLVEADIDHATGRRRRWISTRAAWLRRVDLLMSADPWNPPPLHRCYARMNFLHGVAGKYDLDDPSRLPIGFDQWDRVAFINADRMQRYLANGVIRREAAVLVGYPKVDALVNGRYDAAAVHAKLQLEMHRRTAIYAPTWSPASSLHLAGEAIVKSLVDSGFNVIVKLHDRSLDRSEPKFNGGVDWRARFATIHVPGRIAFVETDDSSPLLAASDVMVTDHSSIGFEFLLLDRPLIVFDAPDLARVARINPEKIALLRSAACVVSTADDVGPAALDEIAHPERRADARQRIVAEMFYEPGTATERALDAVYELLALPAASAHEVSHDVLDRYRHLQAS